jgi:hypothetical protein
MAVVLLRHSTLLPLDKALQWEDVASTTVTTATSASATGSDSSSELRARLVPLKCGGGSKCMPVLPEEHVFAQQVTCHSSCALTTLLAAV